MALAVDHVVWGAPDFGEGNAIIEKLFGVAPVPGGSHAGFGTRNALLGFGAGSYLEVIAPDSGALPPGSLGERLQKLEAPGLVTCVNRSDNLAKLAKTAAALQSVETLGPLAVERKTPAGDLLCWELLFLTGHEFGGLVPFFIDWKESVHPSKTSPACGRLKEIRMRSPHADALNGIFEKLGMEAEAEQAGQAALEVVVAGSRGDVTLQSTPETVKLSFL